MYQKTLIIFLRVTTVITNIAEQNWAVTKWTILVGCTEKSTVHEHGCFEAVATIACNRMIGERSTCPLGAPDCIGGMMMFVPFVFFGGWLFD